MNKKLTVGEFIEQCQDHTRSELDQIQNLLEKYPVHQGKNNMDNLVAIELESNRYDFSAQNDQDLIDDEIKEDNQSIEKEIVLYHTKTGQINLFYDLDLNDQYQLSPNRMPFRDYIYYRTGGEEGFTYDLKEYQIKDLNHLKDLKLLKQIMFNVERIIDPDKYEYDYMPKQKTANDYERE